MGYIMLSFKRKQKRVYKHTDSKNFSMFDAVNITGKRINKGYTQTEKIRILKAKLS
jgi:hypothetical protein